VACRIAPIIIIRFAVIAFLCWLARLAISAHGETGGRARQRAVHAVPPILNGAVWIQASLVRQCIAVIALFETNDENTVTATSYALIFGDICATCTIKAGLYAASRITAVSTYGVVVIALLDTNAQAIATNRTAHICRVQGSADARVAGLYFAPGRTTIIGNEIAVIACFIRNATTIAAHRQTRVAPCNISSSAQIP